MGAEAVRELYPDPDWAIEAVEPTPGDGLAARCLRNRSDTPKEPVAKVFQFPVQVGEGPTPEERFELIRTWHGAKPDGKFRSYRG